MADAIGCPIQYLDELKERKNGDLAEKPLSEVDFPLDLPPHEKLGGYGESKIEFRARGEHIFSFIKQHSESHNRIAIISHGGMISGIIASFLQLPVLQDTFFLTGNTGIHVLEYHNVGRLIKLMNSTTHLD